MKNDSTTKRYFEDKLSYSTKHTDYIYQNKGLTVMSSHEDALYFGYVVTQSYRHMLSFFGQLIFNIKDTRISYPTIVS